MHHQLNYKEYVKPWTIIYDRQEHRVLYLFNKGTETAQDWYEEIHAGNQI